MRLLTVVTSTKLAELRTSRTIGITPFVFHRSLLEPAGFRPLTDKIPKGCDTSTVVGIEYARGQRITWAASLRPAALPAKAHPLSP
jgi:hypothetical protein